MEEKKKQVIKDWVRLVVIAASTVIVFNFIIKSMMGLFKDKIEADQNDSVQSEDQILKDTTIDWKNAEDMK